VIDLFGREEDRPLARIGYRIALPAIVLCGIILVFDLSRPLRFWHLLLENNTLQPMFKAWSPMSTGSWALPLFGLFCLLAALGFRGKLVSIPGALLGLYVAGYTGVLLAVTNRPVWADTPLLGMLLVVSAMSISAALMILLARRSRWTLPGVAALRRIDVQIIVIEFIVLAAAILSLGAAAQALLRWQNVLLLASVILVGMALPLLLHWRRDWLGGAATASALVLAGGFLLRTLIVFFPYGIER
jgi:formate-dependent nitrite reductase membrane component NrfD